MASLRKRWCKTTSLSITIKINCRLITTLFIWAKTKWQKTLAKLYSLALSDWTECCSFYVVTLLLHHRRRGRTEPISSRYTTEPEEPPRLNNTFHFICDNFMLTELELMFPRWRDAEPLFILFYLLKLLVGESFMKIWTGEWCENSHD